MDFWYAFWITIFVGLVSYIAAKVGHEDIRIAIGMIGTASIVIPILVIIIPGFIGMQRTSDIAQMNVIAANTTDKLFSWLGDNIGSMIAGDFAGIVLGSMLSIF